jgi:hypothetical protein
MLDDEVLASYNAGPNAGGSTSPSISAASADASSWTLVDGVSNNQVTVEMTGTAAFYRLRQQ